MSKKPQKPQEPVYTYEENGVTIAVYEAQDARPVNALGKVHVVIHGTMIASTSRPVGSAKHRRGIFSGTNKLYYTTQERYRTASLAICRLS